MGRCQGDDGFPPPRGHWEGGNDMWVGKGGWVPAPLSALGQDLDARITGGGNDMWVRKGGWVPAYARTRGGGAGRHLTLLFG